MKKEHTDAEKILAAQLSYLNFDGYEGCSLGDIVRETQEALKDDPNNVTLQAQKELVDNILSKTDKPGVANWEDWTIDVVWNDNSPDQSGYYGLVIGTGDGDAIVASRGSELEGRQIIPDWIDNDIEFLKGDGTTTQERESQEFMDYLWYNYGDQYDSYTVVGHSLGGHLATHMAITAPIAMQDKINDVTSYDGPNFSDIYNEKYQDQIARMASKMKHYRYSLVGGLLTPLPGVVDIAIESNEDHPINRHKTETIMLDENGKVIPGDETWESKAVQWATDYMEHATPIDETIVNSMPGVCVLKTLILLKTIAMVYRDAKEVVQKVTTWIDDIKYKYLKPRVSGDYEINLSATNSILSDLRGMLQNAKNEVLEAQGIAGSIKSSWAGGAYYRSLIRCNIRSIENDVKKLEKMEIILKNAGNTYRNADKRVDAILA